MHLVACRRGQRLRRHPFRRELPQHPHQAVRQGVQVDVELALCQRIRPGTGEPSASLTHAPHRSWCTSPASCCRAPSAPPAADRLRRAFGDCPPVCPCRSRRTMHQHWPKKRGARASRRRGGPGGAGYGKGRRTPLSALFFFFAESSPRIFLMPFSSPGVGPDSFNAARTPGLGFLNVCSPRPRGPRQQSVPGRGLACYLTHNRVLRFISRSVEVEVMLDWKFAALVYRG